MEKYPSVSVDTYDLVIITAMIGGFATGHWQPFIFFVVLEIAKEYYIGKNDKINKLNNFR